MRASQETSPRTSASSVAPAKLSNTPVTLVLCQFAANPSIDAETILYRPDLGAFSHATSTLMDYIGKEKPEIIVLGNEQSLPKEVTDYWHSVMVQAGKAVQDLHIIKRGMPLGTLSPEETREFGDISIKPTGKDSEAAKDQAALLDIATITIDKIYRNTLLSIAEGPLPAHQKLRSAVLVGAGIESLATGLALISKGYDVTFVEGEADFRNKATFSQKETQALSVKSHGRQLSTEESIPFNIERKRNFASDYTSEGGWLSKPKEALSPAEKEWQTAFNTIATEQPAFLAKVTKLSIALNKLGMQQWDEILKSPELTKDINIISPMYRLFAEIPSVSPNLFYPAEEELRFKQLHNDNFRVLTPTESAALFPGVQHVKSAALVDGSSVDITQLVHNCITLLETKGAKFMWGTKAKEIIKNKDGFVEALRLDDGTGKQRVIKADDYVLSTGNAGNSLLDGLNAHNKVHGLVGFWATIPNIYGLKNSFKVMASEQLCVSNVTISADGKNIYVSGGHGYIGLDKDIDTTKGEGAELKKRFLSYVSEMYPEAYKIAEERGTLGLKSCVRPSTPDGLPIFDTIKAENGKLIVNVGHNCGGFIIAPVMGWVAQQALEGKYNILQKVMESSRPSINPSQGI